MVVDEDLKERICFLITSIEKDIIDPLVKTRIYSETLSHFEEKWQLRKDVHIGFIGAIMYVYPFSHGTRKTLRFLSGLDTVPQEETPKVKEFTVDGRYIRLGKLLHQRYRDLRPKFSSR